MCGYGLIQRLRKSTHFMPARTSLYLPATICKKRLAWPLPKRWPTACRRWFRTGTDTATWLRNARTGGIPGLSLEKCFGHYATAKRESDQKCFITAEGREWLKRPGRFYFLGQISSVPCPQKFANILREISNHPGISVSTVAESLSKNSEPENAAEAHWALARLFKYGLVTHQQAESQE